MEKQEKPKSVELAEIMSEKIKDSIEARKYDITYAKEKIVELRGLRHHRVATARQVGGALEGIPQELIKGVNVYSDSIFINTVSEAASSEIAHSILQHTEFPKLHKEMYARGDSFEWRYEGSIDLPKLDPKSWNTEKFTICISPSYPNPDCTPVKNIGTSTYTSWTCEKK